jgi:hypothetical protein
MELNPTILTRSSSWAERRRVVRAVMTSNREGDSPYGAYIQADHVTMQGACDTAKDCGKGRKGKYGTKHFPGIDKFPSGQLNMSDIAKEFGIGNTNATHNKVECIAWLYHRIRALRKKFITIPATKLRYYDSALGLAAHARREKARHTASTARKDNVGSSHRVTPSTDTGKRRRSSSSPALLRVRILDQCRGRGFGL